MTWIETGQQPKLNVTRENWTKCKEKLGFPSLEICKKREMGQKKKRVILVKLNTFIMPSPVWTTHLS